MRLSLKAKRGKDTEPTVPKDAERHWDVNLILFILSQDKADAIKIQTDDATILDDRRKDGQDHHTACKVSVSTGSCRLK